MKSFVTNAYLHSSKEDMREIQDEAKENKVVTDEEALQKLLYIGYEVEFEIEVFEDGTNKILKIDGIDVSDKGLEL